MSEPVELKDIVTYTFLWRASPNPCLKCAQLRLSRFEEQDVFQNALFDPQYGPVWDMDADLSLAHPHCKCRLEVIIEFDWSKWRALQELSETVRSSF